MMTRKGHSLTREENTFIVKSTNLMYDNDAQRCYAEDCHHSQMSVFVGISKEDCKKLIFAWISFFEDEDLKRIAEHEIEELYSPARILPEVTFDGDKSMN